MSFGFSPGDIALFTKFTYKIVSALKEEGGSKSEFQLAQKQCQGFLDVINEVKCLELSGLPEPFRIQLDEHSTGLEELIEDFRKSVAHYEKSMGESSTRNRFSSAPRKLQWAFMAAQDLDTFKQALRTQCDLVKLVIQGSILSHLNNSTQRPVAHGQRQLLPWIDGTERAPQGQQLLGWDVDPIRDAIFHRAADNITDLVYDRLLSKPEFSLPAGGSVRTLDDSVGIDQVHPPPVQVQRELVRAPGSSSSIRTSSASSRSPTPTMNIRNNGRQNSFTEALNEYLLELGLDPLTEEEAQYAKRMAGVTEDGYKTHRLLDAQTRKITALGDDGHSIIEPIKLPVHEQTDEMSGNAQEHRSGARGHGKFSTSTSFRRDPLRVSSLALAMIELVRLSAKLTFKTSNLRSGSVTTLNQWEVLLGRLREFSMLFQHVYGIVRDCASEEFHNLAEGIVSEGKEILHRVQHLLQLLADHQRSVFSQFLPKIISLKWSVKKEIEAMESLKSTISIMLQLHGIRSTERSLRMLEITSARTEVAF